MLIVYHVCGARVAQYVFLFLFYTHFLNTVLYSLDNMAHINALYGFDWIQRIIQIIQKKKDWSNIYACPNAVSLFIFVVSIKSIFPREYYSKMKLLFFDVSDVSFILNQKLFLKWECSRSLAFEKSS